MYRVNQAPPIEDHIALKKLDQLVESARERSDRRRQGAAQAANKAARARARSARRAAARERRKTRRRLVRSRSRWGALWSSDAWSATLCGVPFSAIFLPFIAIACALSYAAAARERKRIARLPFAVSGYRSLLETGARKPSIEVELSREVPYEKAALLVAGAGFRGPCAVHSRGRKRLVIILDQRTASHDNYWIARWFHRAIDEVLLPLHEVYPIEQLTLRDAEG